MIRPVEKRDLPRVLDLLEALNKDGAASDPRYRARPEARMVMRASYHHDWFERFLPFPGCLVAEEGGALVAMLAGRPTPEHPVFDRGPTLFIEALYVAPAARRRGLGRALVTRYRELAARAGYPQAEVGTLLRDARALSFWRAMGFDDLRLILATGATAGPRRHPR